MELKNAREKTDSTNYLKTIITTGKDRAFEGFETHLKTKAFTYPFLLFEMADSSKLGKNRRGRKQRIAIKKASHLESYALETHECSRGEKK